MTITNGYASLVEFRESMSINDTDDDTELELCVEAASNDHGFNQLMNELRRSAHFL